MDLRNLLLVAFAYVCVLYSDRVEESYENWWFDTAGIALSAVSVSLGYGFPKAEVTSDES